MVAKSRSTSRRLHIASDDRSPWAATVGQPSPTSPLDRVSQSSRVWRNRCTAGIGLVILAALEEEPAAGVFTPAAVAPPLRAQLETSELASSSRCTTSFFRGGPAAAFRVTHVLPFCHLCGKSLLLPGKDTFMYREKGFCSPDCRFEQIVLDDFQERAKRALRAAEAHAAEAAVKTCDGRPVFFIGTFSA